MTALDLDSRMTSLSVSSPYFYPSHIRRICEGIVANEVPLEELVIENTEVGRATDEIGQMMQVTPSLRRLVLDNCKLESIGARLLANYVEGHEGLEELVLDNNDIGDAAMADLVMALSTCLKPVHFVVYQNPVTERVHTVIEALSLNTKWGAYRPENRELDVCG